MKTANGLETGAWQQDGLADLLSVFQNNLKKNEWGNKYRDLALQAGGVSNETVKCGHEFGGTWTQEWLLWQGPEQITGPSSRQRGCPLSRIPQLSEKKIGLMLQMVARHQIDWPTYCLNKTDSEASAMLHQGLILRRWQTELTFIGHILLTMPCKICSQNLATCMVGHSVWQHVDIHLFVRFVYVYVRYRPWRKCWNNFQVAFTLTWTVSQSLQQCILPSQEQVSYRSSTKPLPVLEWRYATTALQARHAASPQHHSNVASCIRCAWEQIVYMI
jgi:hypothetical protein